MINRWYVIGKEDKNSPFGYKQITPKGKWFEYLNDAKEVKDQLQLKSKHKLVVMRRTCEVLNG